METLTIHDLTVLARRDAHATLTPILFVHGYFATAQIFSHYLEFFAARGHPTYAVNLRGRANSGRVDDIGRVSIRDFVEDASSVATHLGRPIIVGHSMGGLIAQKLAEADLVRATILVSPAPPRGIPVITRELMRRQFRYLPAILRSRPVVARFEDFCPLVLNCVPVNEQRAMFAHFVPESGRAGRELLFGTTRVAAEKIRQPVFVVSGAEDHFIPLRTVRRVAARYGAPLHVLQHHAHLLPQEPEWERACDAMASWIDEQGL